MHKILSGAIVASLLSTTACAGDLAGRVAASRAAVKAFATSLQGELGAAMRAGGPANAIRVCNSRAPAIAADISRQQGWQVGRTSLRPRNPQNAPDAWEAGVLRQFEARKAGGESPAQLEHFEVVSSDGRQEFRYMKAIAIPKGAPCLACHGSNIEPTVAGQLKKLYPQDRATGYKTGDLRGAFTIRQPM